MPESPAVGKQPYSSSSLSARLPQVAEKKSWFGYGSDSDDPSPSPGARRVHPPPPAKVKSTYGYCTDSDDPSPSPGARRAHPIPPAEVKSTFGYGSDSPSPNLDKPIHPSPPAEGIQGDVGSSAKAPSKYHICLCCMR
jgi:hypothetical protein